MSEFRELQPDELEPLATGAWILGAGGGGSPYLGYLNMRKLYSDGHRVQIIQPEELADDDLVAVVSNMGAPLVGQERLSDPNFAAKPVQMMEDYLGRKFRAVMSVEIGGNNAIQPFQVACIMGLPVVDADAMGRAFPEAQMTSFAICDLQPFPLALADIRDNEVIILRAASWKWMERLSRKACVEVGSVSATCKAPRTGKEVKESGILHTVTQAIGIGRTVEHARKQHADPNGALVDGHNGRLLFRGKVQDMARRATEGFLRGQAEFTGLDEFRGRAFSLDFQNEWLLGRLDGEVAVMVPDIVCVMDSVTGEAIGTEVLRYGQRVTIIALPPPAILCGEAGLRYVGPRAFGYDVDFQSLYSAEEMG